MKKKSFNKLLQIVSAISVILIGALVPNNILDKSSDSLTTVHFINVGNADSILITSEKSAMLIDAGNNDDAQLVVDYLRGQNIAKLDYVIGTHPHEDHIGGLDAVINEFSVDKIIMPKVQHNTKTFEDVLYAIKNKGLKVTAPIVGNVYNIGKATFQICAPNSDTYDSLNNYSVVIRLVDGNNSFLFTGDAEGISEQEILQNGIDISSDVLKVGHHGSTTSTTDKFLKEVNPSYAIITVGENTYGHPHNEIIKKLQQSDIKILRTDLNGNIVITSDGDKIKVINNKLDSNSINDNITNIYIGNIKSKKLHTSDCSLLPIPENQIEYRLREEAINSGYSPCKNCNP